MKRELKWLVCVYVYMYMYMYMYMQVYIQKEIMFPCPALTKTWKLKKGNENIFVLRIKSLKYKRLCPVLCLQQQYTSKTKR